MTEIKIASKCQGPSDLYHFTKLRVFVIYLTNSLCSVFLYNNSILILCKHHDACGSNMICGIREAFLWKFLSYNLLWYTIVFATVFALYLGSTFTTAYACHSHSVMNVFSLLLTQLRNVDGVGPYNGEIRS